MPKDHEGGAAAPAAQQAGAGELLLHPNFVLRVAGEPCARWHRLHDGAVGAALAHMRALRARMACLAPDACDALQQAICRAGEQRDARRALLAARRAVFNARAHRLDDELIAAWCPQQRAPLAELKALAAQLDGAERAFAATVDAELARGAQRLRGAAGDADALMGGIHYTNAQLHALVDRWVREGTPADGKAARRLQSTLLDFALRAAFKTSPLSSFTPVIAGAWSDAAGADGELGERQVRLDLRFNHTFFLYLLEAIWCDPACLGAAFPLALNPTLRVEGDTLHWEQLVRSAARHGRFWGAAHPQRSMRLSAPVSALLAAVARMAAPPTLASVSAALGAALPSHAPADVAYFVDTMLRLNVLHPCWERYQQDDMLADTAALAARLQEPARTRLTAAAAAMRELAGRYGHADLAARVQLRRGIEVAAASMRGEPAAAGMSGNPATASMGGDPPAASMGGDPAEANMRGGPAAASMAGDLPAADVRGGPAAVNVRGGPAAVNVRGGPAAAGPAATPAVPVFFEDCALAGPRLRDDPARWQPVLDDLAAWLAVLPLFDASTALQSWLAERFVAAYGAGGVCTDIAGFLRGLGPQLADAAPAPQAALLALQRELLDAALAPGGGADVELDAAWCRALAQRMPAVVRRRGVSQVFFGQRTDDARVPAGFVLNRAYSGSSMLMSRFMAGLSEAELAPVRAYIRRRAPGGRYLELSGVFGFNANLHPRLGDAELLLPGAQPGRAGLARHELAGLRLVYNGATDRLDVLDAGGAVHDVYYFGFLLAQNLPLAYQLLARNVSSIPPLWEALCQRQDGPHDQPRQLPRVSVGRVVVSRRTWIIPRGCLPDPSGTLAAFALAVDALRGALALPAEVFVRLGRPRADAAAPQHPDGDTGRLSKPFYVHLDSPLHLRQLATALRNGDGRAFFQEALPRPGVGTVRLNGRDHVAEMQIEMTLKGAA